MPQAKNGDAVKVHYTGRFDDGMIFDSSREGDPLEFTLGQGTVIPGFEDAVRGLIRLEILALKARSFGLGFFFATISLSPKSHRLYNNLM